MENNVEKQNNAGIIIILVLSLAITAITFAIVLSLPKENEKDKFIAWLESNYFDCDSNKMSCMRNDSKDNGEYNKIIYFNTKKYDTSAAIFDNGIVANANIIYYWEKDYYSYVYNEYSDYQNKVIRKQVVGSLSKDSSFQCSGDNNDCAYARSYIQFVKNDFEDYITKANIDLDKLE